MHLGINVHTKIMVVNFLHGSLIHKTLHKHQLPITCIHSISVICVGVFDIPMPNQKVDHDIYVLTKIGPCSSEAYVRSESTDVCSLLD